MSLGCIPIRQSTCTQHDHRHDHKDHGHRSQKLRRERRVGLLECLAHSLQPFGATGERSPRHRLAQTLGITPRYSDVPLGQTVQSDFGHPVIQAFLAAGVQVRALQPPVEHLSVEGQLTHSGDKAQLPGTHIEHDEHESLRMSVEEELIAVPVVVIAQFQNLFLGCASMKTTDAPEREIPDHLTGEGVPGSPHVEHADALSELHRSDLYPN